MDILLTQRQHRQLQKLGRTQRTKSKTVEEIIDYGLDLVDQELDKEDQKVTGKYLSSHRIILGRDLEDKASMKAIGSGLSKGELIRMALSKGLKQAYFRGNEIRYKDLNEAT